MEDSESFNLGISILSQIGSIPMSDWLLIIALLGSMLILLGASAFISASEIAFFSLEKSDLNEIQRQDETKAKQIKSILNIYGILSIKHRLQGWWPKTYWIKYAETIEIKLITKINFK